jgi:hypothetical protein
MLGPDGIGIQKVADTLLEAFGARSVEPILWS